jgi:hypothetical protein
VALEHSHVRFRGQVSGRGCPVTGTQHYDSIGGSTGKTHNRKVARDIAALGFVLSGAWPEQDISSSTATTDKRATLIVKAPFSMFQSRVVSTSGGQSEI